MNIRVQSQSITAIRSDLLVVPVAQGKHNAAHLKALDAAVDGALREQVRRSRFQGKRGETLLFHTHKRLPSVLVLLVGLGKQASIESSTWRQVGATARRQAQEQRAKSMAWFVEPGMDVQGMGAAVLEGILLSGYAFRKYKSDNGKKTAIETFTLAGPGLRKSARLSQSLETVQNTVPGVFLARDLVNEPASVSTPTYLANQAKKLSDGNGLKTEVWGVNKIKAAKMHGLLAVSRGGPEEPRFIKLRYTPAAKPKKKVALVGKGLTFDSGGLSLKPAKSMETMKIDMSGGATVLGTMRAIAALKPQVQVTGYVPSSENMPSGTAQKPGDIISYRNGKTVEVLNTDAEGRLILADALICAVEDKPDVIIDLATLTGACMVALGSRVAGLFSNNQKLTDDLLASSKETGEQLWPMPLVKEYKDDIKSPIADIKNIGGGYGGAITAALFLEEFVSEVPWAHLDIAGPAFSERALPHAPRGGTGFGVRTLVQYILSL